MCCHGINRLDDGFLGVYGKSETLGTLTCGPRVSDFLYTPRIHRLTYMYMLDMHLLLALCIAIPSDSCIDRCYLCPDL